MKAREIVREAEEASAERAIESEMFPEAAGWFLLARKHPEDKKYIEWLLRVPLPSTEFSTMRTGPDGWTAGQYSLKRALGDQLLAVWEGKLDRRQVKAPWDSGGLEADGQAHYLGSISGKVKLPFPVPDKAGAVWVYLIPGEVAPGDWVKNPAVVRIAWDIDRFTGEFSEGLPVFPGLSKLGEGKRVDQLKFSFGTLSPGEYKLKAVWDHRPPMTSTTNKDNAIPLPADYESTETGRVRITEGQALTDIILECPNRVGKAKVSNSGAH
jgi:hypothetical protein